MIRCSSCRKELGNGAVRCRYCGAEQFPLNELIITSSNQIEGYDIYEYYETAYGETVVPNGLLGALTNGTFFTIAALEDGRKRSMQALETMARAAGANAVIGLTVDNSVLVGTGIMVSANGTPVYVVPKSQTRAYDIELDRLRAEEIKHSEELAKAAEQRAKKIQEMEGELTATEQVIVNYILKRPEGVSAMSISSSIPRTISPADISEALTNLKERNIIVLSETGQYNINSDDEESEI